MIETLIAVFCCSEPHICINPFYRQWITGKVKVSRYLFHTCLIYTEKASLLLYRKQLSLNDQWIWWRIMLFSKIIMIWRIKNQSNKEMKMIKAQVIRMIKTPYFSVDIHINISSKIWISTSKWHGMIK
jgi:hypothetical protein